MKKLILIGASAAVLAGVPALAMDHGGKGKEVTRADVEAKVAKRFAKADANGDGAVTKAEFAALREAKMAEFRKKMAERRAKKFAKIDSDGNGAVSQAEWNAFHAARDAKMKDMYEARKRGEAGERYAMKFKHKKMKRHMRMMGSDKWFGKVDANNDGRVTLAEATMHRLKRFDRIDTNNDGKISREERRAANRTHRAEKREKHGG